MKQSISAAVRELAEPVAASLGLSVWDVEWKKEGADWYLRLFIDREGGVSIDDCEAFSRAIDPRLDEADLIASAYMLEVSSPGLERRLARPEHFPPYLGRAVRVSLYRPGPLGREFEAALVSFENGAVTLRPEGAEPVTLPLEDLANLTLKYDFDRLEE